MNEFERYLRPVVELVEDPTSNLVATAIGLAMVVLVFLILVLAMLAWALPQQSKKQRRKGSGKPKKPRRRIPRKVSIALIAGFAVIAGFGWYHATSANGYCTGSCHQMLLHTKTWRASGHKDISCTRCHEGVYLFSAPRSVVTRTRSIYLAATNGKSAGEPIAVDRCLECHSAILGKNVVGAHAVTMSHKEVVDAGSVCSDCHGRQGHRRTSLTVGMSACLRCHDGKTVSADCGVCHRKGADASIRVDTVNFGSPVQLSATPSCGGCHSEAVCDACHGLRMPHPQPFSDPMKHAKPAAFERKDTLCFRCHVFLSDCYECHLPFNAHVSNWKGNHKGSQPNDPWCRNCHQPSDMCLLCHAKGTLKPHPVQQQPAVNAP